MFAPDIVQLLEVCPKPRRHLAEAASSPIFSFPLANHMRSFCPFFPSQLAYFLLVSYIAPPVFANLLLRCIIYHTLRVAG